MSDTPRTDAAIERIDCKGEGIDHIEPDFARDLERENAKLREENAQLKKRYFANPMNFNP